MIDLISALSLAIFVSAFCSVSEAAFYSVSPATVEDLMSTGRRRAKYLKDIKNDIEKYIASILIVNTLANTVGVYLATRAAADLFSEKPLVLQIFPIFLTLLILFLAEMFPKTIGVNFSRSLAPVLAIPFYWLTTLLMPIIWFIQKTTKIFSNSKEEETYSLTEIQSIATISAEEGSIDEQQAMVIDNILNLKAVLAKDIMTPRTVVYSLHKDVIVEELVHEERSIRYSRIPIFGDNEEDIIGNVLRRDIYDAVTGDKGKLSLKSILRKIEYIPEYARVDQLLKKFLTEKQHIFTVVDEYGGFAGILTLEDVLEEILGKEIVDEFDTTIDMQEYAKKQSEALKQAQENQEKEINEDQND